MVGCSTVLTEPKPVLRPNWVKEMLPVPEVTLAPLVKFMVVPPTPSAPGVVKGWLMPAPGVARSEMMWTMVLVPELMGVAISPPSVEIW